jgi:hypothetical protein
MASKPHYLKRSEQGFYSYRRRVPAGLRETIGKREFNILDDYSVSAQEE